ncbi:MAG: acylphosphatase [Erysipelotrichaceae bacterium]|nr:acylphosphatase [Erysipelotrichaceae bacterium]
MTQDIIRKYYLFTGHVQGVGFRWHACNLARKYQLSGRVKNLCDGKVEAEVQGKESNIRDWLSGIYQDRYIQIEDIQVRDLPLVENEREFRVDTGW